MRVFFFLPLFCFTVHAELISLVANNRSQFGGPTSSSKTITLQAGDLATVNYLSPGATLDVTISNIKTRITPAEEKANLPVVAGPAILKLLNFNNLNAAMATISVKRAGEAAQQIPQQVVVIPSGSQGDRRVLLESSVDLITWTSVDPGFFNAGNANRFFRARIAP